ncbi:MAG: type II toxin-antitoxin system HicA family toxin [Armatimonadetes bacterium]|nr:type II toxin-antitoxin system HicA family toxin [Armatimonadota bacterium]
MRLPRGLSGDEIARAFERAGWRGVRMRGSHLMMQKPGHDYTLAVPLHRNVGPGLLRGLIGDAGLTVEEFVRLL